MVNIIGDKLYINQDDLVKPSYIIPIAKKVIILQISRLWEDSNSQDLLYIDSGNISGMITLENSKKLSHIS